MPIAKHLSDARSRSRADICGHDETPLRRQTLSPRPEIAVVSVASRPIFKNVVQFAETAGDTFLAAALWIVAEVLAGCLAYAMAMHGIPHVRDQEESGDPMLSTLPDPRKNWSRPILRIVSADTDGDIGASEIRRWRRHSPVPMSKGMEPRLDD